MVSENRKKMDSFKKLWYQVRRDYEQEKEVRQIDKIVPLETDSKPIRDPKK